MIKRKINKKKINSYRILNPLKKSVIAFEEAIYTLDIIDRSKLLKYFPKVFRYLDNYLEENDVSWGDGEFNLIPLKIVTSIPELKNIYVNIEA